MKKLIATLSILVALLAVPAAFASIDSMDLLKKCTASESVKEGRQLTSKDASDTMFCLAYIMGVRDANGYVQAIPRLPSNVYFQACIPQEVTTEQLVLVVLAWMRGNPEILHLPSVVVVQKAFNAAFPCGDQIKKGK